MWVVNLNQLTGGGDFKEKMGGKLNCTVLNNCLMGNPGFPQQLGQPFGMVSPN